MDFSVRLKQGTISIYSWSEKPMFYIVVINELASSCNRVLNADGEYHRVELKFHFATEVCLRVLSYPAHLYKRPVKLFSVETINDFYEGIEGTDTAKWLQFLSQRARGDADKSYTPPLPPPRQEYEEEELCSPCADAHNRRLFHLRAPDGWLQETRCSCGQKVGRSN